MEYYYSEFNFVLSIVLLNCIIIDYISQSLNLNVILGILQLLYIEVCLHFKPYVLYLYSYRLIYIRKALRDNRVKNFF